MTRSSIAFAAGLAIGILIMGLAWQYEHCVLLASAERAASIAERFEAISVKQAAYLTEVQQLPHCRRIPPDPQLAPTGGVGGEE